MEGAYCIISGEEYEDIESQRVRRWIQKNLIQHTQCKSCKSSYSKMHSKLTAVNMDVKVEEKTLVKYFVSLSNKDSSQWSTCAEST